MILIGIIYVKKTTKKTQPPKIEEISPIQPPITPESPPEPPKIMPKWTNYPLIREINNLGRVLSDIDGHMPQNHIYRDNDKVTWGHETTHGINSNLRMKFSQKNYSQNSWKTTITKRPVYHDGTINAFYCLENRAIIIKEPKTTIQKTAALIPPSLRGNVYKLYLIDQAHSWGDTPLYLMDEWVAYTNGAEVRKDLKIEDRADTVRSMLEFDVYCICLAKAIEKYDPNYNNEIFKSFLTWNIERSISLHANEAVDYLEKIKTNTDANEFRKFTKSYFGEGWTKKTFGF